MGKTTQFILQQQAQFTVGMDRLHEALDKDRAESSEQIASLAGLIGRLAQAELVLTTRVDTLETRMTELAQAQKEQAEAGKATEDRLNVLIAVVERYISSRNGGKQAE